jgi:hypothetical protein
MDEKALNEQDLIEIRGQFAYFFIMKVLSQQGEFAKP